MARHKNRQFSVTFQRWVTVGKSFADLEKPEIAEMLHLRAAHSESASPLPYRALSRELPGLIFQPPAQDKYKFRERYPLLRQAAELLEQWA